MVRIAGRRRVGKRPREVPRTSKCLYPSNGLIEGEQSGLDALNQAPIESLSQQLSQRLPSLTMKSNNTTTQGEVS